MRPPFAYYGGKGRLAPWIASLFPPHRVYVEPFAGSAAVLLAKPPVRHEVLNDLDDYVVLFYRMLRDRRDELEQLCRLTPYSRTEYDRALLDEPGLTDLEIARRWYVRSTQGFGQSATRATGWSISTAQTTPRMYQISRKLDRFEQLAERLRHVFIENLPALEIIARYGKDPTALLYVDPPYLESTRTAGNVYRIEYRTEAEHRALAAGLLVCKATVVISGYHSALYDELFDGWHRVERTVILRAGNGRAKRSGRPDPVEVLWSNRPLLEPGQLTLGAGS